MRLVPINDAEAIIEPFWDGGSSEHPDDKYAVLSEYSTRIATDVRARVKQSWCAAEIIIEQAPDVGAMLAVAPSAHVSLHRICVLDVSGYDVFRVFASLPAWVRMTARATIDGVECVVIDTVGGNTHDEFDGAFDGKSLTDLTLAFAVTENRPAYIELLWLGLANRAAQNVLEARRSPYDATWQGLLADKPAKGEPQIGIFFGARELATLRARITRAPLKGASTKLKAVFDRLREQCVEDLRTFNDPETDIGYYAPNPDRRWVRNRDMERRRTAGVMERLAFVGLIDENHAMSQLAARMALSAAHCDTWCESVMGVFPGASWHHRSFTEEIYCRACALVLDWAGFCLTSHGKQVVRDAIIMKGLPRIESDFKRMEYIRHMNQGIVFSSGRIIGLLGLLPAHKRYAELIDEAERDLVEMINSYVQPDGGTLEGMAYWNYTFNTAMPMFYALARYHGCKNLRDFRAQGGLPDALIKTGDYALAMMSTVGDGTTYMPINDAHADQRINPALIAAYAQISDRPEWPALYNASAGQEAAGEDIYHIIFAPAGRERAANARQAVTTLKPRYDVLVDVGEVSSVREADGLGLVHFHLSCGPILLTHYHQDRGAFVIEAAGEALAIDRGVTTYDHPEVGLIGAAYRHNLLYPESPDGRLITQPPSAAGGKITSSAAREGAILLACDNTAAWEAGTFKSSTRRVFSPDPTLYLIDDAAELTSAMRVSFRLNSGYPISIEEHGMIVFGDKAWLRILPLNWTPDEISVGVEGIDSHLKSVNLLRMATAAGLKHRLLTAIEVLSPEAELAKCWRYGVIKDEYGAMRDGKLIRMRLSALQDIDAVVGVKEAQTFAATCRENRWEVAAANAANV